MNRLRIGLAFGGLVLIGVGGSAAGVLLPYQMADYHIDKIGVGLLFFAYSGGYVLSGVANGPLTVGKMFENRIQRTSSARSLPDAMSRT